MPIGYVVFTERRQFWAPPCSPALFQRVIFAELLEELPFLVLPFQLIVGGLRAARCHSFRWVCVGFVP